MARKRVARGRSPGRPSPPPGHRRASRAGTRRGMLPPARRHFAAPRMSGTTPAAHEQEVETHREHEKAQVGARKDASTGEKTHRQRGAVSRLVARDGSRRDNRAPLRQRMSMASDVSRTVGGLPHHDWRKRPRRGRYDSRRFTHAPREDAVTTGTHWPPRTARTE
jgi:hypothetical protein